MDIVDMGQHDFHTWKGLTEPPEYASRGILNNEGKLSLKVN